MNHKLAVEGALDYEALGFKCGLEIHQQLDTRKLFSPCPSEVVDADAVDQRTIGSYVRRLRATQSELGETDVAVLAEAKRRRSFRYLAIEGVTSLVELDEEPPHPMSDDALDVTLTVAALMGATPADEVHVMRKTVIDGSNTSGFQRTALVATGGSVDVSAVSGGIDVPVWTIAVEEDSARKLEESDGLVTYTLDRLGIPLIEIATGPGITDPKHAQQTAARIGGLLRATKRVKRGLGTIRQDLNVSIADADRVEIKGCQDLRAVPRVIENEVRRQIWMVHIAQQLQERGFEAGSITAPCDVTHVFQDTEAKLVRTALKKGARVLALILPKWAGMIQGLDKNAPRMGREFADHAKVAAGVKGVFHSDELPAYGISAKEVAAIRDGNGLGPDDAFVLCVEKAGMAAAALEAVAERASSALDPRQREVRAAQPDESTRYMRPLPGAARMYPETDVPPVAVAAHWQRVTAALPDRPEVAVAAFAEKHGLHADLAHQLIDEGQDDLLEQLVAHGDPNLIARILTQYLPTLDNPSAVRAHLEDLLTQLATGAFAKEAVPDILAALDKGAKDVAAAIEAAGATAADAGEVEAIIRSVVEERMDFVKERGMGAMGPLMGPVMAKLRGKADGKIVSDTLQKVLLEVS